MYRSHHFEELPETWLKHDQEVGQWQFFSKLFYFLDFILPFFILFISTVTYRIYAFQVWLFDKLGEGLVASLVFSLFATLLVIVYYFSIGLFKFGIQKRFSRTKETVKSFISSFWPKVLSLAATIFGLLIVYFVSCSVIRGAWYLVFIILATTFLLTSRMLFYKFLFPRLHSLVALEDNELHRKILKLFAELKIRPLPVYVLDAGAEHSNPDIGYIPNIRSIQGFYLAGGIQKLLSTDECYALFAQKLGVVLKKQQIAIKVAQFIRFSISLFLGQWFCQQVLFEIYSSNQCEPFGFSILLIAVATLDIPFGILVRIYKRRQQHKADDFVSKELGHSLPLSAAIEHLTIQSGRFFITSWIRDFVFSESQPPWKRILALREDALH